MNKEKNMKTSIYNKVLKTSFASCLLLLACGSFSSCDDKLDIIPKGKTTLENVNDLEALLNTVTKFLANGVQCPK